MKIKKAKGTKKCVIKGNLNSEIIKNIFKASQIENIISYLENKKVDVDFLKEDKKEFLKK